MKIKIFLYSIRQLNASLPCSVATAKLNCKSPYVSHVNQMQFKDYYLQFKNYYLNKYGNNFTWTTRSYFSFMNLGIVMSCENMSE